MIYLGIPGRYKPPFLYKCQVWEGFRLQTRGQGKALSILAIMSSILTSTKGTGVQGYKGTLSRTSPRMDFAFVIFVIVVLSWIRMIPSFLPYDYYYYGLL